MLTAKILCSEASIREPGAVAAVRYALLLSPFAVKILFGFEWAVLVSLLVATREICRMIRATILDTSSINLMKQYEHKLYEPPN
jgi:hypothetical protein